MIYGPAQPTNKKDYSDLWRAIINAVLVFGIAVVVIIAFNKLNDLDGLKNALLAKLTSADPKEADAARSALQLLQTNAGTLFGALTTFLGTAIGAYFGITVSGATSRSAVNAVAAQQSAEANRSLAVANQKLENAQSILAQIDSANAHPQQVEALRSTLV